MGKERVVGRRASRGPGWRRAALGAALLAAVAGAAAGWLSQAGSASGDTPRLVIDRTEVDLGRLPFEARARAVFTFTNGGGGVLTILDVPPVKALKGC